MNVLQTLNLNSWWDARSDHSQGKNEC